MSSVEHAIAENRALSSAPRTAEDSAREFVYRLLAAFLGGELSQDAIQELRGIDAKDTPFGTALSALASAATNITVVEVRDEYQQLFLDLGGAELLPYASRYIAGALHDRPLADLRLELLHLGFAREEYCSEPEDHIAFLCAVMAALTADGNIDAQKRFFASYLQPWAGQFFVELARAKGSRFYMRLAELGRVFMEIEHQAFDLV